MDQNQGMLFLFDISNEVKHFYESSVIFLLKKDYSNEIFSLMCVLRSLIIDDEAKTALINEVIDYHLKWLRFVNELEAYKNHLHDFSKNDVCEAITYTLDALTFRNRNYQKYIQKNMIKLEPEDKAYLLVELELVEGMHNEVTDKLRKKLTCFKMFTDTLEFKVKLHLEFEDLQDFLDKHFDAISMTLSKYMNIHLPEITDDLTKTLQQIIEEIRKANTSSFQRMVTELKVKGKGLDQLLYHTVGHNIEKSLVLEKIGVIEDRIQRIRGDKSMAAAELELKKDILEKRLISLDNLKINLNTIEYFTHLNVGICGGDECIPEDFFQAKIFNHLIPQQEREKLVTVLCELWNIAILGTVQKSTISILSPNECKEEFNDEIGTFHIDEHDRKIYKKHEDGVEYQLDEHHNLVPVKDDINHVYFYDNCGRYYLCKINNIRVYKANDTDSEYVMDSSGTLVKNKEVRDGVTYYFDNLGRYYVNEEGKHIYKDPDSISEYEHDGFGNLIRIRTFMEMFDPCPDDANVTEDFRYLVRTVGPALKECIAEIIIRQPADPLHYLSARLIKYRENLENKEKRATEKEAIDTEREVLLAEERAIAERAALEADLFVHGGSEATYDWNVLKYSNSDFDKTSHSSK